MARLGLFCSGALIAGLVACSVERPGESSAQSATHAEAQKAPAAQPKAPLPPVKAPTPPAPATKTVKAPPPARHDSGHGGANAAKWAGDVEWTTWEAGMAKAKALTAMVANLVRSTVLEAFRQFDSQFFDLISSK